MLSCSCCPQKQAFSKASAKAKASGKYSNAGINDVLGGLDGENPEAMFPRTTKKPTEYDARGVAVAKDAEQKHEAPGPASAPVAEPVDDPDLVLSNAADDMD